MEVTALDNKLNEMVLAGKALEAFEELYADNVVMQENGDAPFVGKDVNRKREQEFYGSVEQFHGAELLGTGVNGGKTFAQWNYDLTFKGGARVKMEQVSVRDWKDGKVAKERFFYNK